MYLKKVEIFGFKSFADKVSVNFEPGVTCVVGPNGCGKSNISDAIRWVLGERRPTLLRGSKMEDVIFSGTEFRKPVNYTEVSLTVDNADKALPIQYEEVVITRRLYRSGDSEYLINKTPCRLKDIYDLILDTGMGSNSYSMIEQGRIDHVLNAQAEERRSLIEEAAGISKYKVKKEEALRKLERTEQNLLRLTDIVKEVERNIKYAERQAKRAEKYKEKFDKLKTLELQKAFYELSHSDEALKKLVEKRQIHEAELSETNTANAALENSVREQDDELRTLDQSYFDEETARSDSKQKLTSLTDHHRFNLERIDTLRLTTQKAMGEAEQLERNLRSLEADVAEKNTFFEKLEAEKNSLLNLQTENAEKLKELMGPIDAQKEEIDREQANLFDVSHQVTEVRNNLHQINLDLAALEQTRQSLTSHEAKLTNTIQALEGQQSEVQAKQGKYQSSDSELASVKVQLTEIRESLEGSLTKLTKNIQHLEKQLHSKRSEIAVLNKLSSSDGQDPVSIVKSFREHSTSPDHVQVLMDLVNIQPGFEVATEAILTTSLKAVVADNIQTAAKLIEQIQTNGAKRATIYIKDRAAVNGTLNARPELDQHPSVIKRLWNAVEVKSGYEGVVANLMGNTYIVDEITPHNADQLANLAQSAKLVTKTGTIIASEYEINLRTSRFEPEESLLVRNKQIEQLNIEVSNLENDLEQDRSCHSDDTAKLNEIKNRETEATDALHAGRASLERVDGVGSQLSHHLSLAKEELEVVASEKAETLTEISRLVNDQSETKQKLEGLDLNQSNAQKDLDELKGRYQGKDDGVIKLESALSEILIKLEHLEEKNSDLKRTIDLLNNQKGEIQGRLQMIVSERNSATEQLTALEVDIAQFDEKRTELEESLSRHNSAVDEVKQKREIILQDKEQLLSKLQELSKRREVENQILHELSLEEMKFAHHNESIEKELKDRYKLSLNEFKAEDYPLASEVYDSTIQDIENLRNQIDAGGAVNLMAIDEYDELKQRYDFLAKQQDDLVSAREDLLQAIRHINRTTKQLFDETLTKVREAFKSYFKALFDGGFADMVLLDEAHPEFLGSPGAV